MFDLLHQRWFSHCGRQKAELNFAVLPFSFPFLREKVLFPLQQGQQFTLFAISLLLAQLTILTTRPVLQRKNMLFSSSGLMTWMGSNIPSRMQVIEGDVIPSCFGYCTQIHVSMYSYIYIQICTFIQCGLFWPVVLFEEIGWWIFREFRATFAPTPEKSCFCKGFLAKWPAKFWGFESLEENLARFKKKCQKLPATISLLQSNKPKEHEKSTICLFLIGEGVISNADNGWKNWFKKRNCDLRSQVQQVGNFWMDFCLFHIPEDHMCGNMC